MITAHPPKITAATRVVPIPVSWASSFAASKTAAFAAAAAQVITQKAASEHPQRHYITRAVGVQPELEFDFTDCALLQGDCLLLCSDGLYNEVPEEELAALTAVAARLGSAEGLIRRANENGGGDNITAVLAIFNQREGQHG